MRSRTWCAVVAAVGLVGAAAPAGAGELRLVGHRHESRGQLGDRSFSGWLEVRGDATYSGERVYADGVRETLAGRVRLEGDDLVLRPARGEERLVFERDDAERRVRWRWTRGDDRWLLVQPGRTESPLETVLRVGGRGGALDWLLNDNRGYVDHAPEGPILRSRQPDPDDIARLVREEGLRTVVSLNGDQDEAMVYRGAEGGPRRVNLAAFIAEQGVAHETLSMSASRAPTDAELVAVFRVLLDDARKPILLHCRGGADRTGVIGALYAIEFLGLTKEQAKADMRRHMWAASDGTEIQGAYVDLYQPGTLRRLLREAGVAIPERYRLDRPTLRRAY